MKDNATSEETTSRRQFTKGIVMAAVAAPIAASLASCSNETSQNNSAGQATPSAAKASPEDKDARDKGAEKKDRPDDGSTITVGGGAGIDKEKRRRPLWCKFYDHRNYPEPGGGPDHKTFVNNKGWHVASLKINELDLTSYLPADGNCQIEISCPGNNNNITFYGRPLAVRFHTGKWKKNGNDNQHTSTSDDRYVSTVGLTIPRSNNKPGTYFEWQFEKDDDCEVKVSGAV